MKAYETVVEAVNDLVQRGYKEDFNLDKDHKSLHCKRLDLLIAVNEFHVDEVHRFEGMTDPGDNMVVYAISSDQKSLKGILTQAYGMYADSIDAELVQKLKIH